jgi:peptidoglycan biosynthesis protein MviN/MurJ (putative lipid II flippase)
MTFESGVIAFASRFVSSRSFELIVAPALADLDFENSTGRGRFGSRVSVICALAGATQEDLRRGSADFLKLTLLSYCYFIFPLALGMRIFKTWADFGVAAVIVLFMSIIPVMVCFWPERDIVRTNE